MDNIQGLISTAVQIKENQLMRDDRNLLYRVVELHKNYCIVEAYPNTKYLACECMTYTSMLNEGWQVVGEIYT